MSEPHPPSQRHVILIVTPNPGAQPTYRAYIVGENDPTQALAIAMRRIRTDETAHVLGAFPSTLINIPGLEPGARDGCECQEATFAA
jgi:hypothetical protein